MFNGLWNHHHHERRCMGPRRGMGRGGHRGRHGGPPAWLGEFFGPPPRAERGGVRYLILDALSEQTRHGYEIIQVIEQRSGGTYRPSPGVVYPTLQMLEELGHVRVLEQDARKVYAITDEGTQELSEHKDEVTDFYERSSEQDWESQLHAFKDLKRQVAQLFMTYKRASVRGRISTEAQSQVHGVLHDAIERIQAILENAERKR